MRSLLILIRPRNINSFGEKKRMKPPLIKGAKLGTVLVVYICVWLQKSPCHCMLLCLCATLSVCLLCKGQRMAIPQNSFDPLSPYPISLIGEDLGVKRIQTLLMCGCAYHLSKIPACTSAFCNNPLAILYLRYYWHVASHPNSKSHVVPTHSQHKNVRTHTINI